MSISSRTRSKLKQIEEETRSLLVKLPEEIHDEIFLKLPGKSILLCRCVSNFFYNLLSSPSFIKNHLNSTKINPKLLCFHQSPKNKNPMIYSIPIDYASISSLSCKGAVLINYPFERYKTYHLTVLGSCNGLVCLKIDSIEFDGAGNKRRGFVHYSIFNPLTGEYKDFLGPNHGSKPRNPDCEVTYGFGYDNKLDDYKLVIISDFQKASCFKIYGYAVISDSWNRIQGNVNYSFRYGGETSRFIGDKRSYCVFFNRSLHWLGFLGSKPTQGTTSGVIICFDISNETIVDIPLPESIVPPVDFRWEMLMNVGVWGDCICITCVWRPDRIEVWVMQDYGVKESWIKKYSRRLNRLQLLAKGPLSPYWQPLRVFSQWENSGK